MWQIIKKYWVWLLLVLFALGIPIGFLWYVDDGGTQNTIYYTFEIVGGVGTLFAVIIALFNNDLQRLYHRPNIKIDLIPATLGSDTRAQGQQLQVNKYFRNLCIKNEGDIQASECELYIESIKINDRVVKEDVVVKWGTNMERSFIPAGGHRTINFVEIKPAPDYMKSDAADPVPPVNNLRGQMLLNGEAIPEDWYGNAFVVTYAVYSISTAEPVRKNIRINYNGQWSANQAEMERFININCL